MCEWHYLVRKEEEAQVEKARRCMMEGVVVGAKSLVWRQILLTMAVIDALVAGGRRKP